MHARQLPLPTRIRLAEFALSHLNTMKADLEHRIHNMERGIAEMYESQEKIDRELALEHLETEHDSLKERINALEDWLIDVAAPGWGTQK